MTKRGVETEERADIGSLLVWNGLVTHVRPVGPRELRPEPVERPPPDPATAGDVAMDEPDVVTGL